MDTGNEQNIAESDKNFNNNSSILWDCWFAECHETLEMQYVRCIHSSCSFRFHISFPFGFSVGKKSEAYVYLVSNVKCRSAFIASHEIELKIAQLHHSILNSNVNQFFFSTRSFLSILDFEFSCLFRVKCRCNLSTVLYVFHKQTRFNVFLSFSHSFHSSNTKRIQSAVCCTSKSFWSSAYFHLFLVVRSSFVCLSLSFRYIKMRTWNNIKEISKFTNRLIQCRERRLKCQFVSNL